MIGGGALALVAAALVVFVILFQWNWLRGPLATYASGQLARPVAIAGDLKVHPWSWTPTATVDGVTVGNPTWGGKEPMLRIPRLTVAVRLKSLFRGGANLPLVQLDRPVIRLMRDTQGRNNWTFGAPQGGTAPLRLPAIQHLVINEGAFTYDDAQHQLSFAGVVSSNEKLAGAARGHFTLSGQGTIKKTPFLASIQGGALINLDPTAAFPFVADIRSGTTHVMAQGTLPRPFDLAQLSAHLHVTGQDLSGLYGLTGLSLPNTPPYDLGGDLTRRGARFAIGHIGGRVGTSDLAGTLTVDSIQGRPKLTADLSSQRLKLADLTAAIGGAPRNMTRNTITSPAQKAMAAKLAAQDRVLPDAPLDLTRMRSMDADVRYRAESVDAGKAPVRQVSMKLMLDHGVLNLNPVSMVLPQGALSGWVKVDARGALATESLDLSLANAQVQELLPKTGSGPSPVQGSLQARARLTSTGNSVRATAAALDGDVTVAIPHGQMRQALAELMGINATKAVILLWTNNQHQTDIRCGVAQFHAENGMLRATRIVLDTGVVQAKGSGIIDLRNETMNLSLSGKSKKFRLVRINAPITLTGRLASPKVGVDAGKAAGQLVLGGVLGALISPLAAALPFVDGGFAKDADCATLLAQAQSGPAPVRH